MTPDERRAQLKHLIEEHDQAVAALREAIDYSRDASIHARATLSRIDDTHDAAVRAIDTMLALNKATLALYNAEH